MSVVLVFKCAALGFALAVAATVGVLAGPVSAGLALVTFLLGVVTNELFQMRLSPVEEPAGQAASDSAFLALMEARESGSAVQPAAESAARPAPPAPRVPPKRNFRPTCVELATGSGLFRTELTARRRRHLPAAPRPRAEPAGPRYDPAAVESLTFHAAYAERVA